MSSLIDRIFSALPAGDFCLPALLRVIEVVETDQVPTASIECADWPRLLINPEFVARHAPTPEKLLMLVLHELHHIILGHTRNVRRPGPVENLAFDMVINAMLSRSVRDPRARALFTDTYAPDRLPQALLRPPDGFRRSREGDLALAEAPLPWHPDAPPSVRNVYARLYFGPGATYAEVSRSLRTLAKSKLGDIPFLIGDHDVDDDGVASLEQRSPALHGALVSAIERWPKGDQVGSGALLRESLVVPTPITPSLRRQLRRAIASIASQGFGFATEVNEATSLLIESVIPRVSRRGVVGRALGWPPILHPDTITSLRPLVASPVHVYVDVSGSVSGILPHLHGAILSAGAAVHPVVHQFSTGVADVSLEAVRRGEVRTTGGTDIHCVTAHMVAHRVRRALIITDGFVGVPDETASATLRGAAVAVALTPGGTATPLAAFVHKRRWFHLRLPGAA